MSERNLNPFTQQRFAAGKEWPDTKILVLGIGNPATGDLGLGVAVVRELLAKYEFPAEVAVVDSGAGDMRLLALIAAAEQAFIIDAIESSSKPGSIFMFNSDELDVAPATRLSLNELDIAQALLASDLGGDESTATIIGVQPGRKRSFGDGLSREVRGAIPKIINIVIELLAASGFELQPRTVDPSTASGARIA
ncbi:MAG: hydrogenase maturation protease [Actinomycetota bacterium]|jgi:hydrogenase maturation protease|nr:hydrogenase maturation protease [Actinomycetota bacterium]MDA8168055.1 hydrogenase maturation protease [Actinomycetota bacterium]